MSDGEDDEGLGCWAMMITGDNIDAIMQID